MTTSCWTGLVVLVVMLLLCARLRDEDDDAGRIRNRRRASRLFEPRPSARVAPPPPPTPTVLPVLFLASTAAYGKSLWPNAPPSAASSLVGFPSSASAGAR